MEGKNQAIPLCKLLLDCEPEHFTIGFALIAKTSDFRFEIVDKWNEKADRATTKDKEFWERSVREKIAGITLQQALRKLVEDSRERFAHNEIMLCLGHMSSDDVRQSSEDEIQNK